MQALSLCESGRFLVLGYSKTDLKFRPTETVPKLASHPQGAGYPGHDPRMEMTQGLRCPKDGDDPRMRMPCSLDCTGRHWEKP